MSGEVGTPGGSERETAIAGKLLSPIWAERIAAMKARILVILGILISAAGFGIVTGPAALAVGPPAQYCATPTTGCMNAWNEGPAVNAYHSNVVNNNFSAYANPDGYETIQYLGPGPYHNQCISDYGNSPTDARAGLNGFCGSGDIAWGANFTVHGCGNNTYAFQNVHWTNGWLTPNSNGSNGAPFYLNSTTRTCYHVLGAG